MSLTESSDLLSVLDQLNPHTFSDGRVWLFGFNTDFFQDDSLCVRRATEGRGLVGGSEQSLLVVQVGPSTVLAGLHEFAGGVETAGFSSVGHFLGRVRVCCIFRLASDSDG